MAGYLSTESFGDWNQRPLLTTIGSFDAPIVELQFPAITICQEQFTPSNPWNLISNFLNFASFDCSNNSAANCSNSSFFAEKFNFLPELLFDKIDAVTENLFENGDAYIETESDPIKLTNSILNNMTNLSYLKKQCIQDFYRFESPNKFFDQYLSNTTMNVNKTNCLILQDCKAVYQSAKKIIFKIETLLGKKQGVKMPIGNGDLLAKFAPLIGNSFTTSLVRSTPNCKTGLNDNEIELHNLFVMLTEKLFGQQNYTISIFDIPAMLTSVLPGTSSIKSFLNHICLEK
jgi:hypothetical protein